MFYVYLFQKVCEKLHENPKKYGNGESKITIITIGALKSLSGEYYLSLIHVSLMFLLILVVEAGVIFLILNLHLQLSYGKFCIYNFPVNSKFTR